MGLLAYQGSGFCFFLGHPNIHSIFYLSILSNTSKHHSNMLLITSSSSPSQKSWQKGGAQTPLLSERSLQSHLLHLTPSCSSHHTGYSSYHRRYAFLGKDGRSFKVCMLLDLMRSCEIPGVLDQNDWKH